MFFRLEEGGQEQARRKETTGSPPIDDSIDLASVVLESNDSVGKERQPGRGGWRFLRGSRVQPSAKSPAINWSPGVVIETALSAVH